MKYNFTNVSIPYRYGTDTKKGGKAMCEKCSVSIPYRYGTDTNYLQQMNDILWMFQFLIGMVLIH